MTKNKMIIGILVAIFCLGLSGVAVSETGIESPSYQKAIVFQPDALAERSAVPSNYDLMTGFETEGHSDMDKGMRAEDNSRKLLLCANSPGTVSEPVKGNCG